MSTARDRWSHLPACPRCGVTAGEPCVALVDHHLGRKGGVIAKPHPGRNAKRQLSRRPNREVTDGRLATWKRLCARHVPASDIAAALGMRRPALDQMLVRARRLGHPDAVHHPAARFKSEQPTQRQRNHRLYRALRREAAARERAEREAWLVSMFMRDSEQDETEE